jgi:hypothetical protein
MSSLRSDGHNRRGGAAPIFCLFLFPLMKPLTKPERSKTQVEILREMISTHPFMILNKNEQIAQGIIVTAINADVALVDIWRDGDRSTTTTHYLPFTALTWDELTQTGFVFDRLPVPP